MLVDINKIKVEDRIRKDFGNIEELSKDIKENGLINPPVVTPEFELIAGERRLRACKHIGWEQIEVRVMTVKDRLQFKKLEVNENALRKDFTFTEMMDAARELERLERLSAEERMKNPMQNFAEGVEGTTRDIVAEQIGLGSGEQYRKAKYVVENADEGIIQKLNEEKISIHKAYEETKRKLNQVENELKKERGKEPKIETKIVEKEVIPDYIQKEVESLNKQLQFKNKDIEIIEREKSLLEKKVKMNEEEISEYRNLKDQVDSLSREKEDIGRQIKAATSLSGLVVEVENFIKDKLSPIKYSRAILEMKNDDIVIENLSDIVNIMESWCIEMRNYLPNKKNIIDMEV